MNKRLLSFFIAGLIAISVPAVNANATEKEENKFNYVGNEENYVVKRGQVNLEDVDINKSFSGNLFVNERNKTDESNEEVDELNYLLSLNDGLEEDLKNIIEKNSNSKIYLGYSTILLKLDKDNNMVPVEKSELTEEELENMHNGEININILNENSRTTALGDKRTYYQLTLYTLVDTAVSSGKRYTVAYADAKWTNNGVYPFQGKEIPAEGEDLIAVTLPERYSLLNDYFWGSYAGLSNKTPTGRLDTVTQNGIVYAFDEIYTYSNYVAHTYTDWVRIGARAVTSDLTPAAETFIGQYVHTFKKVSISPTVSIGKGFEWGVDAGVSFDDCAWPLSSYVSIEY